MQTNSVNNLKKANILLIEDDEIMLECIQEFLKIKGYGVYAADSGEKALALIGNTQETIDLIISDVNLPDISGDDLFRKIRKDYPNQKFILVSGYISDDISKLTDNNCKLLDKPYRIEKLEALVESMTG